MAQIDAPEKKQAYGRRAEQALRELAGGQDVTATWRGVDFRGRPIVQIEAGGVNVNTEMVKRGYAWVYRQYSRDAGLLAQEHEARSARRGLWADPDPVAPWEWRKARRNGGG